MALAALPLAAEALPEVIGMAGSAVNALGSVAPSLAPYIAQLAPHAKKIAGGAVTGLTVASQLAPFISKYAPNVKKIPRFFSHLTKSPIQALKKIDIGKALHGSKDLTTDVGRAAAHLEAATGHNKYLTAAQNLPNLTHEHINKATKLHHHMTGFF